MSSKSSPVPLMPNKVATLIEQKHTKKNNDWKWKYRQKTTSQQDNVMIDCQCSQWQQSLT